MFGITGEYRSARARSWNLRPPNEERRATIAELPDHSIRIIRFYEHGVPGIIGNDDDDGLTDMLQDKMVKDGEIRPWAVRQRASKAMRGTRSGALRCSLARL